MEWYKKTQEELFSELKTSKVGLNSHEVGARIKKYGLNQLPVKRTPLWKIIVEPFKNIFVIILAIAAIFSLITGEVVDAVIIFIIIAIDSGIFYSQQYATSKVLRELKKHSIQKTVVLRGGKEQTIEVGHLVPGDIIRIGEGDKIPADARVIEAEELQVDEAILTGESMPLYKISSHFESDKQVYEQGNMVFQGTYVLSGSGQAVVVETGANTQFGKITSLISEDESDSPVKKKIHHLVKLLVKVAAVFAVLVFILELVRGIEVESAIHFVLAMTVSAVPEGLPIALSIIVVLGMRRMARQKALVRSFKAIEDVGLVTTIATDKTGTLTKNKLSVVDSWSFGQLDVKEIAAFTIDSTKPQIDPLDRAIIEATKTRIEIEKLYPFNLALRMSGAYDKQTKTIYIKGAPEHILNLSKVDKQQKSEADSIIHQYASRGYRVIAFAKLTAVNQPPKDLSSIKESSLSFIGFMAFADELRDNVIPAISQAKSAGIKVCLITGDHFETAYNIGKQVGLADSIDQVITGSDLPKNDKKLAEIIESKTIFSRILPEDKFRILKALKKSEITAMTGDGVNDVPAISNAHVGIAMGSGSDIAKDASGMILLNDNFATIVKAISEGRKIYDNIRRMLFYLLSTSLGEVLSMVGCLLFGLPLPVTAIQILFINLATDTAMVIPLGLEPAESGHMERPPRKVDEPLLSRILLSRMVVIGLTMAAMVVLSVFIMLKLGHDLAYIRTVAFIILIISQWANAFNARSEFESFFRRIKTINRAMLVGLFIAFFAQFLIMFTSVGRFFGVVPIPFLKQVVIGLITIVVIIIVSEIHKLIIRRLVNNRLESD